MNKKIFLIAGGAAALIAATYAGLSVYACNKAEKKLEDWAYDAQIENRLHWSKVSSSPFGGHVSIFDVELDIGDSNAAIRAKEIIVSDLLDEDDRTRIRLQFRGVNAEQEAFSDFRQFSAIAGRNIDRGFANAVGGFQPALNSGLTFVPPFDVDLFVDVDDDAGVVETAINVALPELFDSQISYRLAGQRGLNRQLRTLQRTLTSAENNYQILQSLEELGQAIDRIEIEAIRFTMKDRGLVSRSIALQQRYNTPLDPTRGDADKQRSEHYERQVEQQVKQCERGDLARDLEGVCELISDILLGKEDGFELSIEPKETVRLRDLSKLDDSRTSSRMLARMNLQIDSL